MRFISSKIHTIADYLTGLFLLAMPWMYNDIIGVTDKWLAIITGILIIIMSFLTRYEGGVIRLIPLSTHLIIDMIIGIFFISTFWLFSFNETIRTVFAFVGILAFVFGLFTVLPSYRRLQRSFIYHN